MAGQPDLTRDSETISKTNPQPGETITVSITLQNKSTCPSGSASAGPFHVGFYFSSDVNFTNATAFYEAPVSGCAANSTSTFGVNITFNANAQPGTYYLGYRIDDDNEVSECDETNNGIYYWTITIVPPQPDLTKSTDSIDKTNPQPGDTVATSITIQDQACFGVNADAGAFHVGFYFASSPSFSNVTPFYERPVNGCAANSTVSFDQQITISAQTQPGTYYLGYKINDASNEVSECDQSNNGIYYWKLTVGGGGTPSSWTPVVSQPPNRVQLMLLLTDGTVMAACSNASNEWYKLTPDIHGSYVNGTWSTLPSMADTRLYYSSYVLRDGRVFVAGGEYGTGTAKAEIYDPLSNVWTSANPPVSLLDPSQPSPALQSGNQGFVDSGSVILPDGRILVAPVGPKTYGGTLIYNPSTNGWAAGPNYVRGAYQDEASWVKLPDESILTVDPFGTNSERYIPSLNSVGSWIDDATVPVALYGSPGGEIGPGFLLADSRAFFLGATGNTAFYTPTGTTAKGSWAAGPTIPSVIQFPLDDNGNQVPGSAFSTQGAPPDAAGATMVNGKILCTFSGQLYNDPRAGTQPADATNDYWLHAHNPQYPAPTSFFEYDPAANTFTSVPGPTGAVDDIAAYQGMMLDLPDGTVLYAHQATDLYVYNPFTNSPGSPLAAGKPGISLVSGNGGKLYHLRGTKLNGISQGAAYGDDAQMDTNYPIVRLTATNGDVTYARTFNWSSTGVQTGSKPVTTDFALTNALTPGKYSLVAVANGISSDPVTFDPTLAVGSVVASRTNGVTVSWRSHSGLSYQVQRSTDPAFTTFTVVFAGIPGIDGTLSRTDTGGGNNSLYRVAVEQ